MNEQPDEGASVLHCGHLDGKPLHFFKATGLTFCRPDGTGGQADWIVACGPCYDMAEGKPKKVIIRGDGSWTGLAVLSGPGLCS